jgi:hypothetical protein
LLLLSPTNLGRSCPVCMQRLELLIALTLVRQRQPTDAEIDVQHPELRLGAAVLSLPSGLLALIGVALTKL